ncbi:MAG: 5-(carboxyamino)imidazole ribonucleotide synthase [bacterium]|nr:5-(carboxyamino)imidazole ribonucleotide synthase [bacterium]
MEKLVTSEIKLGIIAGGQLGKMLVLAASNWNVNTYIMDKDEHCPASASCSFFFNGDPLNFDDVYEFGHLVDVVTLELENVNVEALKKLKSEGKKIIPDPDKLEIIQDKGLQKQFYDKINVSSSSFTLFDKKQDIINSINSEKLSYPFIQKLRKGGYDGRGVSIIHSKDDLDILLDGASEVEKYIEIDKEISAIVARNQSGEVKCHPTVEMEFNPTANLVERLICPSTLPAEIENQAEDIAIKIITELNLCGLLAVEMFVDKNKKIWVNEIAPRPHNSGHHTIESAITSQFEQQLRAIFNLPLGSTKLKLPAVMINLLGEPGYEGKVRYEGLTECMAIEGVKIHLYGKKITKPFRKMGHVTVLAPTIEEAKTKADFVKQKMKVVSW